MQLTIDDLDIPGGAYECYYDGYITISDVVDDVATSFPPYRICGQLSNHIRVSEDESPLIFTASSTGGLKLTYHTGHSPSFAFSASYTSVSTPGQFIHQ